MKTILAIACAVLIGYAVVSTVKQGGAAPTPEVFADSPTLAEALEKSNESGMPVFAVVTAEWCGPCQRLKRETLSDTRVESWIKLNTVPVFIDADEDREAAIKLGVQGIPASFLLREGEVLAKRVGYADPESYLAFLKGGMPAD